MKAYKSAVCLIAALLIIAFTPFSYSTAGADEVKRYARADSRSVYFCDAESLSTARFMLPYTYCVEILADRGEWYKVCYADDVGIYKRLEGYCMKEGLTEITELPENLYLNLPVTVTYKTDEPADGALGALGSIKVTAAYYGEYLSGATYYSYVCYNGEFGYIDSVGANYELNPLPDPPEENKPSSNAGIITAIIITALAATAVLVLYLTGKKPKISTKE